jgi:hypothetical protein
MGLDPGAAARVRDRKSVFHGRLLIDRSDLDALVEQWKERR